jgi:uncharacterized protein
MAVTRQLFELQELDDNIESTRKTLDLKKHQLNNRETLDKAAAVLSGEQKTLDELKAQRRNAENEAADINAKINEANKQLYGGRINNPKELGNLQAEVNQLTAQKDQIETTDLGIIDKLEAAEVKVKTLTAEYQKMDANWAAEQIQLAKDIELLTKTLAALQANRQETTATIDQQSLALYESIRKKKKPAVAKVEQGICRACRLSLSASALQKARGGHPVQCGTCGRILFIAQG